MPTLCSRPSVERLEDRSVPALVSVASGDVNGDGAFDLVVGSGEGSSPRVQVIDGRNGAVLRDFVPLDPTFTGGLVVAAGDADNDGFAEVAVGPARGGAPHIQLYDGETGDVSRNFFAYEDTFRGGVSVAIAESHSGGPGRLVVGSGFGGGPRVRVVNADTLEIVRDFFAYEDSFRGGVDVGTSDLNGDGVEDFLAGAGPTGGPRVRAFDGRTGDNFLDFAAYEEPFRGGVNVFGTRYPLGAGKGILTGPGVGGGPVAKLFRGSTEVRTFLVGDGTARDGVNVADFAGFDRDDVNEVAASADGSVHFFAGGSDTEYSPFAPFGGGVGGIAFTPPTTSPLLPDADQDGASDARERLAGTDPNQAPSVPPFPPIPPVPATGSLTGTWNGTLTQTPAIPWSAFDWVWNLTQTGNTVTGTRRISVPGNPSVYGVMSLTGMVNGNVFTYQDTAILEQSAGVTWFLLSGDLTISGSQMTGPWSQPGGYSGVLTVTGPSGVLQQRWEAARAKLKAYYDANRNNPGAAAYAHQMLNIADLSHPTTNPWARGMVLEALEYSADDIAARPEFWSRGDWIGIDDFGFVVAGNIHVAQHLVPSFAFSIASRFQAAIESNPGDPLGGMTAAGNQIVADHTAFFTNAVIPGVYGVSELSLFTQIAAESAIPNTATRARELAFNVAIGTLLASGQISVVDAASLFVRFGGE